MRIALILASVMCIPFAATYGQKMTYEEAKRDMPRVDIPAFWITDYPTLADRWKTLQHGKVSTIAESPGGRALWLITYGESEDTTSKANFNSAIGGREPKAYRDKASRRQPVIFFVGPVHGQETEGLVSLVNLIHVMETGRDLRGKDQAALQGLGRRCRLLILPTGNPDGLVRFEPRTSMGMTSAMSEFWGMGTLADGTIGKWPDTKRLHPHIGPEVGFMGCYFDDRGVNPMHDEFFAPMSTEAPAILAVARKEAPDLAVSFHSHAQPPDVLRPAYVPLEVQREVRTLAERYYARLDEFGLPHTRPFEPRAEEGPNPASFNLTSAVYHTSGATTFTFESPRGVTDEKACHVDFEQILDIHLHLLEAMMRHALEAKAP